MQLYQTIDPHHLDVDVHQRMDCAEEKCRTVSTIANMKIWQVYNPDTQIWRNFAFCCHEHALVCFPVVHLNQA